MSIGNSFYSCLLDTLVRMNKVDPMDPVDLMDPMDPMQTMDPIDPMNTMVTLNSVDISIRSCGPILLDPNDRITNFVFEYGKFGDYS